MSLLQVGLYSKHHKLVVHYDDFHRPVLSDSEVNRNFPEWTFNYYKCLNQIVSIMKITMQSWCDQHITMVFPVLVSSRIL